MIPDLWYRQYNAKSAQTSELVSLLLIFKDKIKSIFYVGNAITSVIQKKRFYERARIVFIIGDRQKPGGAWVPFWLFGVKPKPNQTSCLPIRLDYSANIKPK